MLSFGNSYISPWLKPHPTLTLMELLCHVIRCFPVNPTCTGTKLSGRHITPLLTAFLVKVKLKTEIKYFKENHSQIENIE